MKHEMLKTFLHGLKRHTEEGNIDWQYENYVTGKDKAEVRAFITEDDKDDPLEFMEVKIRKRFRGLRFELKIYPNSKHAIWRWQKNFNDVQEIFNLAVEQLNGNSSGSEIERITEALK